MIIVNPATGGEFPRSTAAGGVATRAPLGSLVQCLTAGGALTVQRPSPRASSAIFAVLDESGVSAANPITVDGDGDLIDGLSTCVVRQDGGAAVFVYDGTQWRRLAVKRRLDLLAEVVELASDAFPVAGASDAPVVFRPGAATSGIFLSTWAEVQAAIAAASAQLTVYVDTSLAAAHVPIASGTTDCRGLVTFATLPGKLAVGLTVDAGAVLFDPAGFDGINVTFAGQLDFRYPATGAACFLSGNAVLAASGAGPALTVPDGDAVTFTLQAPAGGVAGGAFLGGNTGVLINLVGASVLNVDVIGAGQMIDGFLSTPAGPSAALFNVTYDQGFILPRPTNAAFNGTASYTGPILVTGAGSVNGDGTLAGGQGFTSARTGGAPVGSYELTVTHPFADGEGGIVATVHATGAGGQCVTSHVSNSVKRVETRAGGLLADLAFDVHLEVY
jgi:hypothetical protein